MSDYQKGVEKMWVLRAYANRIADAYPVNPPGRPILENLYRDLQRMSQIVLDLLGECK